MRSKPFRNPVFHAPSLGLAAALAFVLSACDPAAGPDKEEWFGVVSRDCYHNDGPALRFQMDTAPYSGCATQHAGEFSILADNSGFADILQPGRIVVDTQVVCPVDKCADRTVIRIEILSVDSASVKADIRIESNATGNPLIRSGKAVLSRCPNRYVCG